MPCLSADRAQPLEVALRRRQHAGGSRHRLDDHRGDGRWVVQRDDALELVREVRAPGRLAAAEGVVLQVVRVRQVIHAGQHAGAEHLAVGDDAADRDAAEADAVIALLAADEPRALRLAAHAVIADGDLQRRVHGLGSGIHEEHVIEIAGRELRDAAGQLERGRMAHVERGRVVELARPARAPPRRSSDGSARRCSTTVRRCRRGCAARRGTCSTCPGPPPAGAGPS